MIRRYKDSPFKQNIYPYPSEDKAGVQQVLATAADTGGAVRQFARTVLLPGFDIPLHLHEIDMEIAVLLSGYIIYNDNGVESLVGPGDVMIVRAGERHAMRNPFNEPAFSLDINLADTPKK
ncbi:MAG: cupin domain-containing protein [Clostridia bacterium]|nr:cupin domain-containing protein [Clostridia bacterium]